MIRSRIPLTALLFVLVLPACTKRVAQAAQTPPATADNSLKSEKTSTRLPLPPAETEPATWYQPKAGVRDRSGENRKSCR